jgi:hypothetical protein
MGFAPGGPLEASTATVSLDPLIADMPRLLRHVSFVPLALTRGDCHDHTPS